MNGPLSSGFISSIGRPGQAVGFEISITDWLGNAQVVRSFGPANSPDDSVREVGRAPTPAPDAHIRLYELGGKLGGIFIGGVNGIQS